MAREKEKKYETAFEELRGYLDRKRRVIGEDKFRNCFNYYFFKAFMDRISKDLERTNQPQLDPVDAPVYLLDAADEASFLVSDLISESSSERFSRRRKVLRRSANLAQCLYTSLREEAKRLGVVDLDKYGKTTYELRRSDDK